MEKQTQAKAKRKMLLYHLTKKSENLGWNVDGKINFVSPNENFLGKAGFLQR